MRQPQSCGCKQQALNQIRHPKLSLTCSHFIEDVMICPTVNSLTADLAELGAVISRRCQAHIYSYVRTGPAALQDACYDAYGMQL